MHPEQIKAEMRMRGTKPADLAKTLHVSRSTVGLVIAGRTKSARIARAIAAVTGKPLEKLWPGKYEEAA